MVQEEEDATTASMLTRDGASTSSTAPVCPPGCVLDEAPSITCNACFGICIMAPCWEWLGQMQELRSLQPYIPIDGRNHVLRQDIRHKCNQSHGADQHRQKAIVNLSQSHNTEAAFWPHNIHDEKSCPQGSRF